MNIYRLIVLIFAIVFFSHFFDLTDVISESLRQLITIPNHHYSSRDALIMKLAFLIAVVAVIKLFVIGKDDDDD